MISDKFLISRNPLKMVSLGGKRRGVEKRGADRFRFSHWHKSHRHEKLCLRKLLVQKFQNRLKILKNGFSKSLKGVAERDLFLFTEVFSSWRRH